MPWIIGRGGSTSEGDALPWSITPGQTLSIWFTTGNYEPDHALVAFAIPFVHPVFVTPQVMTSNHGMRIALGSDNDTVFTVDVQCREIPQPSGTGTFCLAVSRMP